MDYLTKAAGATSEIWQIYIKDFTTNQGLPGLVFNSAGLVAYYHRDTDTTATAISLVTMTMGTYTPGGFKEIDATNMPGWYQFCPPNAAIATGAKNVVFDLWGVDGMAAKCLKIQLTTANPDNAIRFRKNAGFSNFKFTMYLSGTRTPAIGKSITATRAIDSGSFASCANSAVEIGVTGRYMINLASSDLNGDDILFTFTASGCDPVDIHVITQVA